jgi:hypothetical protein
MSSTPFAPTQVMVATTGGAPAVPPPALPPIPPSWYGGFPASYWPLVMINGYNAGIAAGNNVPNPKPSDTWETYEASLVPMQMYDGQTEVDLGIGSYNLFAVAFNSALERAAIYRWMSTNDPNSPVIK